MTPYEVERMIQEARSEARWETEKAIYAAQKETRDQVWVELRNLQREIDALRAAIAC